MFSFVRSLSKNMATNESEDLSDSNASNTSGVSSHNENNEVTSTEEEGIIAELSGTNSVSGYYTEYDTDISDSDQTGSQTPRIRRLTSTLFGICTRDPSSTDEENDVDEEFYGKEDSSIPESTDNMDNKTIVDSNLNDVESFKPRTRVISIPKSLVDNNLIEKRASYLRLQEQKMKDIQRKICSFKGEQITIQAKQRLVNEAQREKLRQIRLKEKIKLQREFHSRRIALKKEQTRIENEMRMKQKLFTTEVNAVKASLERLKNEISEKQERDKVELEELRGELLSQKQRLAEEKKIFEENKQQQLIEIKAKQRKARDLETETMKMLESQSEVSLMNSTQNISELIRKEISKLFVSEKHSKTKRNKNKHKKDTETFLSEIASLKEHQSTEISRIKETNEKYMIELNKEKKRFQVLIEKVGMDEKIRQQEFQELQSTRLELMKLNVERESEVLQMQKSSLEAFVQQSSVFQARNSEKEKKLEYRIEELREEMEALQNREIASNAEIEKLRLHIKALHTKTPPVPLKSTANHTALNESETRKRMFKFLLQRQQHILESKDKSLSTTSSESDVERLNQIEHRIQEVKKRRSLSRISLIQKQEKEISKDLEEVLKDRMNSELQNKKSAEANNENFETKKTQWTNQLTRAHGPLVFSHVDIKSEVEQLDYLKSAHVQEISKEDNVIATEKLKLEQAKLELSKEKQILELQQKRKQVEDLRKEVERRAYHKKLIDDRQRELRKDFERRLEKQKEEQERFRMQQQDEEGRLRRHNERVLALKEKEIQMLREARENLLLQEAQWQERRKKDTSSRLGFTNSRKSVGAERRKRSLSVLSEPSVKSQPLFPLNTNFDVDELSFELEQEKLETFKVFTAEVERIRNLRNSILQKRKEEEQLLKEQEAVLKLQHEQRLSELISTTTHRKLDEDMVNLLKRFHIEKAAPKFEAQGGYSLKTCLNLSDSQFIRIGFKKEEQISSFRNVLIEAIEDKTLLHTKVSEELKQVLINHGLSNAVGRFVKCGIFDVAQAIATPDDKYIKIGFKSTEQISQFRSILSKVKCLPEPKEILKVLPPKEINVPLEKEDNDLNSRAIPFEILLKNNSLSHLLHNFEAEGIFTLEEARQLQYDDLRNLASNEEDFSKLCSIFKVDLLEILDNEIVEALQFSKNLHLATKFIESNLFTVNDIENASVETLFSLGFQSDDDIKKFRDFLGDKIDSVTVKPKISQDLKDLLEEAGLANIENRFIENRAYTIAEALQLPEDVYFEMGFKRSDQVEKIKSYMKERLDTEKYHEKILDNENPDYNAINQNIHDSEAERFTPKEVIPQPNLNCTVDYELMEILEATGMDSIIDRFIANGATSLQKAVDLNDEKYFEMGMKRQEQIDKFKSYLRDELENLRETIVSANDESANNDLKNLLESNNLNHYFANFEDEGIDTLEAAKQLTIDDIERLGIRFAPDRKKIIAILHGETTEVFSEEQENLIEQEKYFSRMTVESSDQKERDDKKHSKKRKKKKKRRKENIQEGCVDKDMFNILEEHGIQEIESEFAKHGATTIKKALKLSNDVFHLIGFKHDSQIDGFRDMLRDKKKEIRKLKKQQKKTRSVSIDEHESVEVDNINTMCANTISDKASDSDESFEGQASLADDAEIEQVEKAPKKMKKYKKKKKRSKKKKRLKSDKDLYESQQSDDPPIVKAEPLDSHLTSYAAEYGAYTSTAEDKHENIDSDVSSLPSTDEDTKRWKKKMRKKKKRKAVTAAVIAEDSDTVVAKNVGSDSSDLPSFLNSSGEEAQSQAGESKNEEKKKRRKKKKKKKKKTKPDTNEQSDLEGNKDNSDSDDAPTPGAKSNKKRSKTSKTRKDSDAPNSETDIESQTNSINTDDSVVYTGNKANINEMDCKIQEQMEEKTPDPEPSIQEKFDPDTSNEIFYQQKTNKVINVFNRNFVPVYSLNWDADSDGIENINVDSKTGESNDNYKSAISSAGTVAESKQLENIDTIFLASKRGDLKQVKNFVEAGISVQARDVMNQGSFENSWIGNLFATASGLTNNQTPLYLAVLNNHLSVAKYLLERGAKDENCECYNISPSNEMTDLLEEFGFTAYGDSSIMTESEKEKISLIRKKKKELSRTHDTRYEEATTKLIDTTNTKVDWMSSIKTKFSKFRNKYLSKTKL